MQCSFSKQRLESNTAHLEQPSSAGQFLRRVLAGMAPCRTMEAGPASLHKGDHITDHIMHFHSGKVPLRHAAEMRAWVQQAHDLRQDECSVHMQASLAQAGLRREKRRRLVILDGVSGVLHPGRMTLLLGPPSSGKSTLLKVLAGLQASDRNLKVRLVLVGQLLQALCAMAIRHSTLSPA